MNAHEFTSQLKTSNCYSVMLVNPDSCTMGTTLERIDNFVNTRSVFTSSLKKVLVLDHVHELVSCAQVKPLIKRILQLTSANVNDMYSDVCIIGTTNESNLKKLKSLGFQHVVSNHSLSEEADAPGVRGIMYPLLKTLIETDCARIQSLECFLGSDPLYSLMFLAENLKVPYHNLPPDTIMHICDVLKSERYLQMIHDSVPMDYLCLVAASHLIEFSKLVHPRPSDISVRCMQRYTNLKKACRVMF